VDSYALLDLLPIGVVVLDGALRLRRANARARAILDGGGALVLSREGVIAANPPDNERLQRVLLEAATAPAEGGYAVRIDLPRCGGRARLVLHVRALAAPGEAKASHICLSLVEERALPSAALEGLSPRRREVLECLVAGERPQAIAVSLGLSEHTVRAYVKDLHRHFGAHSRGELLARFIPPQSA
jgi:DNA-binding CsgD family transcriptional regulator